MGKAYLFCRFWTPFSRQFPFDQFNHFTEDELEAELRGVVEKDGPSDEALREWFAKRTEQAHRSNPGSVRTWEQDLTPKLRDWFAKVRTQVPKSDDLLVHKLRCMGWLKSPTVWSWAFLKRHILVATSTQYLADEVAKVLGHRYQLDGSRPRFGSVVAETLPLSQQALFDQEADECIAATLNPLDKTELANVAKYATGLLKRLLRPVETKPENQPATSEVLGDTGLQNSKESVRKQKKRGRPSLKPREITRRLTLVKDWSRAKENGVEQKDFCSDNGITLLQLNKIVNWNTQREKRDGKRI